MSAKDSTARKAKRGCATKRTQRSAGQSNINTNSTGSNSRRSSSSLEHKQSQDESAEQVNIVQDLDLGELMGARNSFEGLFSNDPGSKFDDVLMEDLDEAYAGELLDFEGSEAISDSHGQGVSLLVKLYL